MSLGGNNYYPAFFPMHTVLTAHSNNHMNVSMNHQNALRSASGALYQKIAMLMRMEITNGRWVPGERLPSLDTLARHYAVALVTMRQAIQILEDEGLVRRYQGRGTFISEELPERRWLKLESTWDALLQMWEHSRARLLKVEDNVSSPVLHVEDGTPAPTYRYMRRVHLSDGVPYAVIDIYIDQRLYRRHPQRFDNEMVIRLLEEMEDVEIMSARQCLTIGAADLNTAELLDISIGAPVGEVRRVLRDGNGVVIYVGEAIYRGDMVKLERELKQPNP